ncbi:MAG: HAD hydrolase-like protein [Propionibacteriaceae bacterium]
MSAAPNHQTAVEVVIFDVDGTLLDSAPGIVDGFRHAVTAVGLPTPSAESIRGDLGPPAPYLLAGLGVPPELIPAAYAAYREHYRAHGVHQAEVYPGVLELLDTLHARVRLATATAKLVSTAEIFLARHGLDHYFEVIGGSADGGQQKAEIIATTLVRLGDPDPRTVIMIGDRHSDLTGAAVCGVRSVGVTWGYGSRNELIDAGADHLVSTPAALLALWPPTRDVEIVARS